MSILLLNVVIVVNAVVAVVVLVGDIGGGGGVSICQATLYAHNKVRMNHADTPPMTYSHELAVASEAWAMQIASVQRDLVHSTNRVNAGENLFLGQSFYNFTSSVGNAVFSW